MTKRQDLIQNPTRPACDCQPDIAESDYHDAFCVATAWDREHGFRAMRFVKTDGTLSQPMVKRDGRFVPAH